MNSIVEQLHKSGDEVFSTRKKSQLADLIESQERRIKKLEAKCDYWRDHYKDLRQRIEAAERHEPVAECTDDDKWNCKYCRKTETCEALQDKRNYATPQPAPAWQPMPQWRKKDTWQWADGHADHEDGQGPYETRTLYAPKEMK